MVLSRPLGITRWVPQENSVLFAYNKSFIRPSLFDQDARILASFYFVIYLFIYFILFYFFGLVMELDSVVLVHKHP